MTLLQHAAGGWPTYFVEEATINAYRNKFNGFLPVCNEGDFVSNSEDILRLDTCMFFTGF